MGRLVLTPALRVQDAPDSTSGSERSAQPPASRPVLLTNAASVPSPAAESERPSLLAQLVQEEVSRAMSDHRDDPFLTAQIRGQGLSFRTARSASRRDEAEARGTVEPEQALRLTNPLPDAEATADESAPEASEIHCGSAEDFTAPEVAEAVAPADGTEAAESAGDDVDGAALDLDLVANSIVAEDLADAVNTAPAAEDTLEDKISALEALVRGQGAWRSAEPEPVPEPVEDDGTGSDPVHVEESLPEAAEAEEAQAVSADAADASDWRDTEADEAVLILEEPDLTAMLATLDTEAGTLAEDAHTDSAGPAPLPPPLTLVSAVTEDEPQDLVPVEDLIEWEDHAEAESDARPLVLSDDQFDAEPDDMAGEIAAGDASDAIPMIDEAVLRDMVSEIVRQELQGVLGERITRNVRKLVRREIHRVMMTQDFD